MTDEQKQEFQRLIRRNQFDVFFKRIASLPNMGEEQEQEVIVLQQQWNDLKKQQRRNLINFDNANIRTAQITTSLLDLLNNWEEMGPTGTEEPAKPSSPVSSEVWNILFLAANPTDSGKLRLGEEHREISEALRRSKHRNRYQLGQAFAVRPRDLTRAMLDENPAIVHFSGHGLALDRPADAPGSRSLDLSNLEQEQLSGGIALEDQTGNTKVVEASVLSDLFSLSNGHIQCVLLNACHSQLQAEAIIEHVPHVIGMNTAVPDRTAIAFATGFYDALGAGRDIPAAFDYAKIGLKLEGLPGHDIPEIMSQ
ncbi:MAG: CHAT domain-containing protein [Bacteroidota bacterium]